MSSTALTRHRQTRRSAGFRRVEINARAEDVALVRRLAAALADPATRAKLEMVVAEPKRPSIKDVLAAMPVGELDLTRLQGPERDVEL